MAHSKEERQQAVEIYKNNATNVSLTCKAMNISRKTWYEWYNTDDDFADAVNDAKEEIKDFGESQLLQLMKGIPTKDRNGRLTGWKVKPDTAAVIFFNKTKNKDRGYIERQEVVTPKDERITGFTYVAPEEEVDNEQHQ